MASARVSLFLSLSVQWPKGSCYNLRSCRFSAQNLCPLWPPRPCVICPHDTSLTSSPSIFPLALSISATLASLLILRCARRIPAPGPLHGLLLPPRTSSPQRAERLIPPLLYHLPQMLPSREVLPNLFTVPHIPPLTLPIALPTGS